MITDNYSDIEKILLQPDYYPKRICPKCGNDLVDSKYFDGTKIKICPSCHEMYVPK